MKQEIDNNAMWAAFRQELALQGELQVVAAIDNALNNLGFTIEETSTIVPIPLKQGEQKSAKNIVETWKDMRLEVYQQASGNRHEPNYSDDTTKMFSLNDIDEIIEKMSEQKPTDKVEPKFREGDVMITLQEAADGVNGGLPVVVSIDEEYYHCTNELIAIKDQNNYEYPPINRIQKPAWSEEDEAMWTEISDLLWEGYKQSGSKISWDDIRNWVNSKLKSLRPQKQWKPSDE